MNKEERQQKFAEILKAYQALEAKIKQEKGTLVWDTKKGIFGAATCERLFAFFERVGLDQYENFLDIGSGDGRAVLIASLFTKASGVEIDEALVEHGKKIQEKLGLDATFVCDDFKTVDFSKFSFLFVNPDQGFHKGLEPKLLKEMSKDAVLWSNNNIFLPEKLKRERAIWIEQIPIIEYKNK